MDSPVVYTDNESRYCVVDHVGCTTHAFVERNLRFWLVYYEMEGIDDPLIFTGHVGGAFRQHRVVDFEEWYGGGDVLERLTANFGDEEELELFWNGLEAEIRCYSAISDEFVLLSRMHKYY